MTTGPRRRRSVKVTVNCVADHYAAPGETIIEFVTADGKLGGLIGFWYDSVAGTLAVEPYRLDDGVTVRAEAHTTAERWQELGATAEQAARWAADR